MKKIVTAIFALSLTMAASGQSSFSAYETRINSWRASIGSDAMPKGAKEKTVEFPTYHYCIDGCFQKGILVEGQKVKIYDTTNELLLVLEGRVSYVANRLVVTGVKHDYEGARENKTYGMFHVSNGADNTMVYNPKKAGELLINDSEIYYYCGYFLNSPTIVSLINNAYIIVDGKSGKAGYDELTAPLLKSDITRVGYDKPYALLLTISKDAIMKFSDGVIFKGNLLPKAEGEGDIRFLQLAGVKNNYPKGHKTISVKEDGYRLIMETVDDPDNPTLLKETVTVSNKNQIPAESYWRKEALLEKMSELNWVFRNGDTYVGKALYKAVPSDDGMNNYGIRLTSGTYRYANGDSFEGNLSGEYFHGIAVSGTTRFRDGTSETGNWLAPYQLKNAQYDRLAKLVYPSVIRDSAVVCYNDNLYASYMAAARMAEYGKKYDAARENYLSAKSIKPDEMDWDSILDELDRNIFLEKRRKALVEKYGSEIGNKVAKGDLELGMSKRMVLEAFDVSELLCQCYLIGHSTDYENNPVEMWEFDYDEAKRCLERIMPGQPYGYDYLAEIKEGVKYRHLKFVNGKLVELRKF